MPLSKGVDGRCAGLESSSRQRPRLRDRASSRLRNWPRVEAMRAVAASHPFPDLKRLAPGASARCCGRSLTSTSRRSGPRRSGSRHEPTSQQSRQGRALALEVNENKQYSDPIDTTTGQRHRRRNSRRRIGESARRPTVAEGARAARCSLARCAARALPLGLTHGRGRCRVNVGVRARRSICSEQCTTI